jgi:hypothetical protein
MYKTKLNKWCFEANLDGRLEMWCNSPMDFTWLMMVKTTSYTNFSNLLKMKLVKVLNKPNITRIVTKTSCTLTPTSMIVCLLQFCWHQVISNVDASDCNLYYNLILCFKWHLILSFLEDLKSRPRKMNSIGHKCNEAPILNNLWQMNWGSQEKKPN